MHELFITRFLNDYLSGPANAALGVVGLAAQERPWANWLTVEILVALLLMVFALLVRSALNSEKPGTLQHIVELVWAMVKKGADDAGVVAHQSSARNGHIAAGQRRHHAVFTINRVCRRQQLPRRLLAQHVVSAGRVQAVGGIRLSAFELRVLIDGDMPLELLQILCGNG